MKLLYLYFFFFKSVFIKIVILIQKIKQGSLSKVFLYTNPLRKNDFNCLLFPLLLFFKLTAIFQERERSFIFWNLFFLSGQEKYNFVYGAQTRWIFWYQPAANIICFSHSPSVKCCITYKAMEKKETVFFGIFFHHSVILYDKNS